MINFHRGSNSRGKMLRICAIFFLFVVAVQAHGEFIVLNAAESFSFKGNDLLKSKYAGDVINAIMAESFSDDVDWPALYINDPFQLPEKAVILSVEGARGLSVPSALDTFEMSYDSAPKSLTSMRNKWSSDVSDCSIDFEDADRGMIMMRRCFGKIEEPKRITSSLLKSSNKNEDNILKSIAGLNAFADVIRHIENSTKFTLLKINLNSLSSYKSSDAETNKNEPGHTVSEAPLEYNAEADENSTDIDEEYPEDSTKIERPVVIKPPMNNAQVKEALSLIASAVANIQSEIDKVTDVNFLFVVLTSEHHEVESKSRSKREIIPGSDKNDYNLATYYDQNYPVIFNIILWFMVAFGLSLLAICYAIAEMDPGRDSIIYRMTSTRMKKDN